MYAYIYILGPLQPCYGCFNFSIQNPKPPKNLARKWKVCFMLQGFIPDFQGAISARVRETGGSYMEFAGVDWSLANQAQLNHLFWQT